MSIAIVIFGISIFLEIATARCLFSDGSYNFIEDLRGGSFTSWTEVRCFADNVLQFPLILAIKLGVTHLETLRWAFGLGCFFPWPLAMLLCYRLSPPHFWLVALACAAGYLNTAFIAVGEHSVAHAFYWPALFALLFVRPLTPFAAIILICMAAVLVHSYESLLFLGPTLALLACWRALNEKSGDWRRLIFLTAIGLFLAATVVAAFSVLNPNLPTQLTSYHEGMRQQLLSPAWTVGWSMAWLLLMGITFIFPKAFRLIASRAGFVMMVGAILLWGFWPLLMPERLNPATQSAARFLNLVIPLLLLPMAVLLACKPAWFELRAQRLAALAAVFLIAQSLWQITATWQWHGYISMLRSELAARSGPVLPMTTSLAGKSLGRQALQFDWNWANPSLSIAISRNGKINSILLPRRAPEFVPFDPFSAGDLPKLERYGIDYSNYNIALAEFRRKLRETPGLQLPPIYSRMKSRSEEPASQK